MLRLVWGLFFLSGWAQLSAQQVTLNFNKARTEDVLVAIKQQTGYALVFSDQVLDVNRRVTIDVKNKPLQQALDLLLEKTNVVSEVRNNKIYFVEKKIRSEEKTPRQLKKVTGVVKDAQGEPVIGANVTVKGTATGTITDLNGNFTLQVPDNSILQVSYIGYAHTEVQVKGNEPLTVVLKEDFTALEEIVVVGYGQQAKVNLTGAVATVSNKELASRPITSVSSGIQGIVPGMTVTSGQGRPGQDGGTIRVRGTGTLNNANPYILVDGVEVGTMNQIDPNDIESISVLKDAASAAIYGSKASNGVILITTRRGKAGRAVVNYNGSVGWQSATGHVERMNSADAALYYNKALLNGGKSARFSDDELESFRNGTDPYHYPDTDWHELGYQGSGFIQQHNANVNGGNESVKYMVSLGFLGQNGILKYAERQQFNMRSNIDVVLSDVLTIRTNMSYINNAYKDPTNSYVGGGSDQIIRQLNRIAPWIPYKNADGSYGTISDGNPVAWIDLEQTIDRKNQNFSGIFAIDMNLMKGLKLTAQGSYISNIQDYKEFIKDIQYNSIKYDGPNRLDERTYLWNRSSFDGLANYAATLERHHWKALLGYHAEVYNYKQTKANRRNFPNNNMTDLNAGTEATQTNEGYSRKLAMMSYFGRVNYDYAGKYLFEANFRADASSRFSPDNRWGYFPSLSAGWRISEEPFMESVRSWLQSLKIRASWGQLGNQDALDDYYPWLVTYSVGENYPFDGIVNTGITATSHKLASITWEKATTWGVGLDFSLFHALNISVDYYKRKTTGIIMDVPVPGSFGLGAYKDNVGAMENSGVELSLDYRKKWNDWVVGINANAAINKNKILNLGGVDEIIDDYYINRVGHSYKSFYTYVADGLFQSQEEADAFTARYGNPFGRKFKAGDIRYVDVNQDGKLTSADREVVDAEQPKFTFGINLNAEWKNFDASVFMQGAIGVARYFNEEVFGDFTGDTSHPSTAWFDAWSPENPNGKFPYISEARVSPSHPTIRSSFWTFKTNYLRFKNVQVGYTFPASWIGKVGLSKARIYYSGENLFKIDSLPVNIDPEAPSGRGSHYPQISTHSFGVSLTF